MTDRPCTACPQHPVDNLDAIDAAMIARRDADNRRIAELARTTTPAVCAHADAGGDPARCPCRPHRARGHLRLVR